MTYRVYLTNDLWDDAANPLVDGSHASGNGRNVSTLTAFARGANDVGFSAVQGTYRAALPFPIPRLPGVVTLPGPDVEFDAADSNPATLNGNGGNICFPAIATSTTQARDDVIAAIKPKRRKNYVTCNPNGPGTLSPLPMPGSIENFIDETAAPNPYNGEVTNDPQLASPGIRRSQPVACWRAASATSAISSAWRA